MLINRKFLFTLSKRCFCVKTDAKPISICVVGSGPAGFYCCQGLLKNLPASNIDIYEKLPVPFGLVRYGVAPDHPEVKNVINSFSKTASDPRIKFIGNVTLGKDVSLKDLQKAYNVVVLAYGADQDVKLGIPGENLDNVISARRFVGWYNGLPSDKDLPINFNAETVSIFGQGNVAIDVARILLKSVDELKKTDITDYSLSKLAESKIKRVMLIGRRGPLQVAFSIKELREVLKLPDIEVRIDESLFEDVKEALPNLPRPKKRLAELMLKASSEFKKHEFKKSFQILFLRSPLEICGSNSAKEVTLGINSLESLPNVDPHNQKAKLTDVKESLACELVFRSIGYKSSVADEDVPFLSKNCIGSTKVLPGVYSAGWVSTGPTGVILSTMTNAFDTVNVIVNDMKNGKIELDKEKHGYDVIKKILKDKNVVTVDWAGWTKIDEVEMQRGKEHDKPREKIVDINEMLKIGGDIN
ncbi:NADPH:adrenodoxin oxidoreductase, mitochondrial [Planococcus citri]|uniref:NADPH:adrenodoxin oxidoreductase, mitochondrial n=1 Tax=Planococcus citri TaxID=170843 RepID=UPI0031F9837C